MSDRNIIFLVGAGRMGTAIMQGLQGNSEVITIDPEDGDYADINDVPEDIRPNNIFFCVKPQIIDDIIIDYDAYNSKDITIGSVIAGKNIAYFTRVFTKNPIIRIMPNLPSAIGLGANVFCLNELAKGGKREDIINLIAGLGDAFEEDDESNFDLITAVSGSGPAYIYYFAEAFKQAAMNKGLGKYLANFLVNQTFIGSAKLADKWVTDIAELRDQVTSPGGTTEAGLATLMGGGNLVKLLEETIESAKTRSEELGKD